MDTLVLLPSFIKFFDEAKSHTGSSPANLVILFLAFGKKLSWFTVYVSIMLNLTLPFSNIFYVSLP